MQSQIGWWRRVIEFHFETRDDAAIYQKVMRW